jgi:anaerobic selenocysteine-containing dehydrogenase
MQEAMKNYQVIYTADAMSSSECGLEVWIKDGRLAKIYGNKEVPINHGTACAKRASGQQLVYPPYRLKYPMIQVGEKERENSSASMLHGSKERFKKL